MVRLDGFGKIDQHDTLELACRSEQRQDGEAPRGFLLSNAQFAALGVHFPQLTGREEQCRAEFDEVREIVLQDLLQASQQPSRREVQEDLTQMLHLARGFLENAEALGPLPDWSQIPSSEPEGPLSAFRMLPEALYNFAARARRESKCDDAPAAQLLAFAAAADDLAWELKWGDVVAQEKIASALPPTFDYAVSSLADAFRIARRLDVALGSALKQSKKCGGPVPRRTMKDATVRLADLLEYYGGKFTHNPRVKTEYKGRPQTAAGHFVFKFLKTCDASIAETTVSQFMAEAVRFRRRRRQAGSTSF